MTGTVTAIDSASEGTFNSEGDPALTFDPVP